MCESGRAICCCGSGCFCFFFCARSCNLFLSTWCWVLSSLCVSSPPPYESSGTAARLPLGVCYHFVRLRQLDSSNASDRGFVCDCRSSTTRRHHNWCRSWSKALKAWTKGLEDVTRQWTRVSSFPQKLKLELERRGTSK